MVTKLWLMAALLAGQAHAAVGTPSFCARLAGPLRMKPPQLPERAFWRRDLLGSFAGVMFGGVSVVQLEVVPPEPRTVETIDRAGEMCKTSEKGANCIVAAPFSFRLVNKGQEIIVVPEPGETGEVTVRGTIVECRDQHRAP